VEQPCLLGDLRIQTLLKSGELLTPEKAYPEAGPYHQEPTRARVYRPRVLMDRKFRPDPPWRRWTRGVRDPPQSGQDRDAAVVGPLEDSLVAERSLCGRKIRLAQGKAESKRGVPSVAKLVQEHHLIPFAPDQEALRGLARVGTIG